MPSTLDRFLSKSTYDAETVKNHFDQRVLLSYIIKKSQKKPIFYFDQAPCHKSPILKEFMDDLNINYSYIPSRLTTLLQPADVCWIKSFKRAITKNGPIGRHLTYVVLLRIAIMTCILKHILEGDFVEHDEGDGFDVDFLGDEENEGEQRERDYESSDDEGVNEEDLDDESSFFFYKSSKFNIK
ncbi:unnamed protein product [Brachionus calyciflorus]|uniref:DDE-1 domain-containing protein n=1 Tax=Brachionus calyciflorus TaxID=104777 RepID=A0A813NWA0_9BILA|nr:unnamed protein product [Brachionus calyciflorus]